MSESLTKHVDLLGKTLGAVIGARAGRELIEQTQRLHDLCERAAASGETEPLEEAARVIADLDLPTIQALLRTFTAYFRLVNQAEQDEVVRINRERARRQTGPARPESIDEVFLELRDRGYGAGDVAAVLSRLDVEPTLTAHPTEARRLTMLYKLRRLRQLLARLRSEDITPDETLATLMELHNQVSLIVASDEVRAARPTVADEVEQGLYFLRNTIWDTVPWIQADLQRAFLRHFETAPELPVFLRYRSWIGGDRDGNPNVTPEVTRWTVERQRREALDLHYLELRELRRELSISPAQAPVPPELYAAIDRDAAELPFSERDLRRFQREPYRMRLTQLMERLQRLLDGGDDAYRCADYIRDLELIAECLRSSGFAQLASHGRTGRALLLARTFGFCMAALDIRQHSRVHAQALSEIFARTGRAADYDALPESERLRLLTELLDDQRAEPLCREGLPETARAALGVFDVVRDAIGREPDSIGCYIVSMTDSVSAVLEPMLLARMAGLWRADDPRCPIEVVPLFETIEDLDAAGDLLESTFDHPVYARHLAARGNAQEVMLGYSDSNKDGGYVMANWALHEAQQRIGDVCRRRSVDLRLFHGRGGSIGRGGGRAHQTILAMPSVVQNGRIRFTEQGEVISFRYAEPHIAHRHLEQIVNAMIRTATDTTGTADAGIDSARPLLERMAASSMAAYRNLVGCDEAWEWYSRSTPIALIGGLPIASRPAARGTAKVDFANLRAIPWGFAWTQTRYLLPGWFGIGTALADVLAGAPADGDQLRDLYRKQPFFQSLIDNARHQLARCRLEISAHYSRLAGEGGDRMHERIRTEFETARDAILTITGLDGLLADNPVIRHSIERRNPYTDVLNLLQVELLRRHRDAPEDERDELKHALFLSLNGISAAMQTTG